MFGKNFFNWPDAIIESNPKYICKGTSDNSDLENEQTVPFETGDPVAPWLLVLSGVPWLMDHETDCTWFFL